MKRTIEPITQGIHFFADTLYENKDGGIVLCVEESKDGFEFAGVVIHGNGLMKNSFYYPKFKKTEYWISTKRVVLSNL